MPIGFLEGDRPLPHEEALRYVNDGLDACDDLRNLRLCVSGGASLWALLAMLHGLGADGSDFVPIARALDLSAIGPVRFVFPHAPVRPVICSRWPAFIGLGLLYYSAAAKLPKPGRAGLALTGVV